jgi:outer membrane protein TolC
VKLNELDLSLFKIQNGRKLTKMALAQKMGIDINSPIEVSDDGLKDPSGEISPSEYKLENVVSRPELRLLQNNVKISESAFRIAKGSFLPTIGVGANYFFMNPNIHRGIANEFTNDYIFAFQVSVPIFHAFQKHHMYNLTKSNLLVAQSKLQDAHQQIALEYIMVSNELEETIKQIQITKLTMEQANENLRISQDRFNEGALQTRDLLEAQALWQEAQSHYIEAKAQYNTLLLKQKKASGQIE